MQLVGADHGRSLCDRDLRNIHVPPVTAPVHKDQRCIRSEIEMIHGDRGDIRNQDIRSAK